MSTACFHFSCGMKHGDDEDTSSYNSSFETTSLGSRITMPNVYAHQPARPESMPPQPQSQSNIHRTPTLRASGATTRRVKSETWRSHQTSDAPVRSSRLTEEDKRINRIIAEAKKHQATTARVTHLAEFQNMSVTLPAGEDIVDNGDDPSREAPPTRGRGRGGRPPAGPMFRGKKSWTSSVAADTCVAEAKQADRYYRANLAAKASRFGEEVDPRIYQLALSVLDEDEEREQDEGRQRWKAWLPKKWTTPRSTLIDI